MRNEHHNKDYFSKDGIIIITMEDNNSFILDNESDADISKSDYITIMNCNKTKEKILFKNIFFAPERIKRLANTN